MNSVEKKFLQYVSRGYFSVDSEGRIWRHRIHRKGGKSNLTWLKLDEPRRAETNEGDYLAVKMELWSRSRSILAHRAVYLVLVGPIPDGYVVNHKSETGDKHDNRPSNLEACTSGDNTRHAKDVLKRGPWYTKCKCQRAGLDHDVEHGTGTRMAYLHKKNDNYKAPPMDSHRAHAYRRVHLCEVCFNRYCG